MNLSREERLLDQLTPQPESDVHVWQVRLVPALSHLELLNRLLSADEQQRAGKFVRPEFGSRFVIAHGALRTILSSHCGVPPNAIPFQTGIHGKPSLDSTCSNSVEFNLSHSNEIALVAVSKIRPVGIDIERRRENIDPIGLGKTVFSDVEMELLTSLPIPMRHLAFFDFWTRKEALLKALGCGLLQRPTMLTATGHWPIQPMCVGRDNEGVRETWSVLSLDVEPNYSAAVCVQGTHCTIINRDWQKELA